MQIKTLKKLHIQITLIRTWPIDVVKMRSRNSKILLASAGIDWQNTWSLGCCREGISPTGKDVNNWNICLELMVVSYLEVTCAGNFPIFKRNEEGYTLLVYLSIINLRIRRWEEKYYFYLQKYCLKGSNSNGDDESCWNAYSYYRDTRRTISKRLQKKIFFSYPINFQIYILICFFLSDCHERHRAIHEHSDRGLGLFNFRWYPRYMTLQDRLSKS